MTEFNTAGVRILLLYCCYCNNNNDNYCMLYHVPLT